MNAKREYRNRPQTEVAVLDELVDRTDDGMGVFELRAAVEADIDELEDALERLKADNLIIVESSASATVIKPADRVVPDNPAEDDPDQSIGDWLRERFPF